MGQNKVSFINTENPTSCYIILSGAYREVLSKTSPIYGLITKAKSPNLLIESMGENFNELITNNHNTLVNYLLFSKESYVINIKKYKIKTKISKVHIHPEETEKPRRTEKTEYN